MENATVGLTLGGDSGFEKVMSSLGLATPLARFAAMSSLTATAIMLIKPSFAFTESGARPWRVSNPGNPAATSVPWWLPAFGVGFISATFL
jgi:hypothetical protein